MPELGSFTAPAAVTATAPGGGRWRRGDTVTLGEELRRACRFLKAAGIESPELDAQVLLADLMGCDRSRLFSGDREDLAPETRARYQRRLVRRAGRLPLPYITGKREFWSRELTVDGRVLVPRPETEVLVHSVVGKMAPDDRLLDVGTGSGNVIVAVAAEVAGMGWKAVDISPAALEVAAANFARHGLQDRVSLCRSDLFAGLERLERFDVIASNPPYIATGEIMNLAAEIRCHEPRCALDGGREGMALIRRLIAGAPRHLRRRGWLIMEFGDGQERAVAALLRRSGAFGRPVFRRDLAGRTRVVEARRK